MQIGKRLHLSGHQRLIRSRLSRIKGMHIQHMFECVRGRKNVDGILIGGIIAKTNWVAGYEPCGSANYG